MSVDRSNEYYVDLINQLRKLPAEAEWVEFKDSNGDPEEIGKNISALANAAALMGKVNAYLVWGVNNETHEIIGTSFKPKAKKIGNEELENWLSRSFEPKTNFSFIELVIEERAVVLLSINPAFHQPVQFKTQEYIRIGSYTKKLKDHPEKERELWRIFDRSSFENATAVEHVSDENVLKLLNYPDYFYLLESPLPEDRVAILDALNGDALLQPCETGSWRITNLGAILFAKNLDDFKLLRRKAIRVIHYKGKGRFEAMREKVFTQGYASEFKELIDYIMTLVPSNEIIQQALRRSVPMFPELAVRELVANALIHQDFSITGTGAMVEIFDDRMEITNPGIPLIDVRRFLGNPPCSRNEDIAFLMRRFRICEERGSGIAKVVSQIEAFQLPAPFFEALGGSTRVILFAHKPLNEMDRTDRVRACFLHACLKRSMHDYLTNASLRQRFGVEDKNKAIISRYIREAIEEGVLKPFDSDAPKRLMKYVPEWP